MISNHDQSYRRHAVNYYYHSNPQYWGTLTNYGNYPKIDEVSILWDVIKIGT